MCFQLLALATPTKVTPGARIANIVTISVWPVMALMIAVTVVTKEAPVRPPVVVTNATNPVTRRHRDRAVAVVLDTYWRLITARVEVEHR